MGDNIEEKKEEEEMSSQRRRERRTDEKLDTPLSELINEDMQQQQDKRGPPPPYRPLALTPRETANGNGNRPIVPGELSVGQYNALCDLMDEMDQDIENDNETRVTQSDLMRYSQKLMAVANLIGRDQ